MASTTTRILIWGKTYPELSTRYIETVCTGGSLEDGRPIRIYPVPHRYLPELNRYTLYSWIEAPIELNPKDTRPESFRVTDPRRIRIVGQLKTDRGWLERRKIIFRDTSWHYRCLDDLKQAQKVSRKSLGLVRVGEVLDVALEWRSEEDQTAHEAALARLRRRWDLFDRPPKHLEFLGFRVRMRWRCERLDGPNACRSHSATIMDWGLGELGRREGAEKALQKMQQLADLDQTDLHLFMGNMKARPHVFGVVALWYPKKSDVQRYPLQPDFFDPVTRVEEHPPSLDAESQLPLL